MYWKLFLAGSPPGANFGEHTQIQAVFPGAKITFDLFREVGHAIENPFVQINNGFGGLSLSARLQDVSQCLVSSRKRIPGKINTVIKIQTDVSINGGETRGHNLPSYVQPQVAANFFCRIWAKNCAR